MFPSLHRQSSLLNNKSFFLYFFHPGIEYLYENHLLKTDEQDVAQFLYKGEGLNKTAIGEREISDFSLNGKLIFAVFSSLGDYLGEKKPFNEKVLKAFVELHDFTNLILVQALR